VFIGPDVDIKDVAIQHGEIAATLDRE
jgi:hypothetical protein